MSVGVRIHAQGALDGIREAQQAAQAEISRAVFRSGAYARTVVRANASSGTHPPGRPHIPGTGPGPNVATGDYRSGISQTNHQAVGEATSEVGTTAVQAARLEYGFVGRDSAGRYFQQRPFPHWEPATPVVEQFASTEMDKAQDAIARAFGGSGG